MSARSTPPPTPPPEPGEDDVDLMREALVDAGTTVWSWDFERRWLGGIDAGVVLLGYAPGVRQRGLSSWNALMHPDDAPAAESAMARHLAGETPRCDREYRMLARDGGWRWIVEHGRIVARGTDRRPLRMVGTLTDATRRHAAEDELQASDARLRDIARHVPGVLYQFRRLPGSPGGFVYASERCAEVLGFDGASLMDDASTLYSRIFPDDRAAMQRVTDASASRLSLWRHEFRLDVPGRGWRWILGISSPRAAPDGAVHWCGYMQDVTELRTLEQAREDVAAADATVRAKSEFLSRMSHELRTPLNAVLGFAQLMELDRDCVLEAPQRRRVTIIRESGEHLLRMIGDLLDHSRIEAGQMAVSLVEVPLAPLLARSAEMLAPQAAAAQVGLVIAPVDPALAVTADATRLRQVVFNLLGNAIKYNRPGGTVEVSAARGDAHGPGDGASAASHPAAGRQRNAGDCVTLRFADTGVGIAPGMTSRLFEPFDRLDHAGSGIEGAGMGLAISRALVSLMHGHIDVVSEPGVGSTFSVVLPAAPARASPAG